METETQQYHIHSTVLSLIKLQEISTSRPEYYVHTQQLFLHLFEHGLAYRASSSVNYDPVDKTVLANEQVSADGYSWRSGAKVEKRYLKQWFLKITDYAEPLLRDLDKLGNAWPENVKNMQRNWIGRSQGVKVRFQIHPKINHQTDNVIETFTTRLDTLLGVQFLAVSTNHPLVQHAMKEDPSLEKFVESLRANKDPASYSGFRLANIMASNPMEPLDFSLPVFVAPYVIDVHGSGAIMGVPGHDVRDNMFWHTNCPGQTIKTVIEPDPSDTDFVKDLDKQSNSGIWTKSGVLCSESCGTFGGLTSKEAKARFLSHIEPKGVKDFEVHYKLRDWLISRQRYWGTPIPIIHCNLCGSVAVPSSDLPVKLPIMNLTGKGGSPLAMADDGNWVKANCPKFVNSVDLQLCMIF